MSSAEEYTAYYLERLRQGHIEEAFFGLIDAEGDVSPILIEAFGKEENCSIRAQIVRCIWQQRREETIGFLAEVLHDSEPAVWREALDGLVALGTGEALQVLRNARTKIGTCRPCRSITLEWLDEGIEQVQSRTNQQRFTSPSSGE